MTPTKRSHEPHLSYGPVDSDGFAPFELVRENIGGHHVTFRKADVYGNLTELCRANHKEPFEFLRLPETKAFIAALDEQLNSNRENPGLPKIESVITRRGGRHPGTWAHPQLMMQAARWISPKFSIACNEIVFRHMAHEPVAPATPAPAATLPAPDLSPVLAYLTALDANYRAVQAELDTQRRWLKKQCNGVQSFYKEFKAAQVTVPPALTWTPTPAALPNINARALPPAPDVELPSPQFMRVAIRQLVSMYVTNRFGPSCQGERQNHRLVYLGLYADLKRLTGFDVHARPATSMAQRTVSLIHRVEGEGLLRDLYRLAL